MAESRLLHVGVRGNDVMIAQIFLNFRVLNSRIEPLDPDGVFGDKTRIKTVEFQHQALIPADGVIGPITMAALTGSNIDLTEFFNPFNQSLADLIKQAADLLNSKDGF